MTVQKKILDLTGSQYLVQKVKSAINDVDSSLSTHIADTDIHVTTADKNRWNNNTYVFRYSSTALVASSTNSNALLDNTDNLKVGDKVIDSNGVLFSITAIDTANSTFTIGTALIDLALDANVVHTNEINSSGIGIIGAVKEVGGVDFNTLTTQGLYGTNASGSINNPENSPCVVQVIRRLNSVIQIANVSSSAYKSRYIRYCADITAQPPVWQSWIKFAIDNEVVHKSGDENVNGIKNFKNMIPIDGDYLGNESSVNARTNICLRSNRDTDGKSGIYISKFRQNKAQGSMGTNDMAYISFDILENEVRTNSIMNIQCSGWVDNVPTKVKILSTIGDSTFGSSVRPSKINDLNPSSLSMPDLSNGIDISSYITVNGGNKESLYTPPANGWISVRLSRTSGALGVLLIQGNMASSGKNIEVESGVTTADAMLPVVGGVQVSINSALADGVVSAYFYPCLGNV